MRSLLAKRHCDVLLCLNFAKTRVEVLIFFMLVVELSVLNFKISATHDALRVHSIFNGHVLEPFDHMLSLVPRHPVGLDISIKLRY